MHEGFVERVGILLTSHNPGKKNYNAPMHYFSTNCNVAPLY
jgi:hypothetical protein